MTRVNLDHLIFEAADDRAAPASDYPGDAFSREMVSFYDGVDRAIAGHSPRCTNRGECCKFGSFGHRLYVTDVELRYFAEGLGEQWIEPALDADSCPHQQGGICTARQHRPLGCRVFFCDSEAQSWQNGLYEEKLAELKRIGEKHAVAYRYREWLSALRERPLNRAATR